MSDTLACTIAALSDEQRQRRAMLAAQLMAATSASHELPDGYVFAFGTDDAMWTVAAEFVDLERRCCPFFSFTLTRAADNAVSLQLTGPAGAKEFIAAEVFGG